MTSTKKLNDQELLLRTKDRAQAERNLTLEVIELLTEVARRRLHLKSGFESLHQYCVKELKYSDGCAARRIKAMKLVESAPEVAKAIGTGALNLTSASQLQRVFEYKSKKREPFSRQEKLELINKVQNQSTRQVERIMAEVAPEAVATTEKVKPVGNGLTKLEIFVDDELLKKLERLKSLTSHKNKSFKNLIGSLVEQELKRIDPEQKKLRHRHSTRQSPPPQASTLQEPPLRNPSSPSLSSPNSALQKPSPQPSASALAVSRVSGQESSRYISKSVRLQVWMRDQGRCTFIDTISKRKCESNHRLQYEHIRPFAMGGDSSAINLRLLCQAHNNLMAIHQFGEEKMKRYLSNGNFKNT